MADLTKEWCLGGAELFRRKCVAQYGVYIRNSVGDEAVSV
jgi:hypothetical protein